MHALEYLAKSNVDGMIIVTGSITQEEIAKYAQDIPIVMVGYDFVENNVRSINIDNVLGGYMATLHLLQQGHVNILLTSRAYQANLMQVIALKAIRKHFKRRA